MSWESAADLKLEQITGKWNNNLFRTITPEEAHAGIGQFIDSLVVCYFDEPKFGLDDLERSFVGIGLWALAGWRVFTDATLDDLCSWTLRTLAERQRCYGKKNITRFGVRGLIVRMSDKYERLMNMWETGQKSAVEPIEDTYMDLLGYATIGLMLIDDVFELPLERDVQ